MIIIIIFVLVFSSFYFVGFCFVGLALLISKVFRGGAGWVFFGFKGIYVIVGFFFSEFREFFSVE